MPVLAPAVPAIAGAFAADKIANKGQGAAAVGDAAQSAVPDPADFMNAGKNRSQIGDFQYEDPTWGHDPSSADFFAQRGLANDDRAHGINDSSWQLGNTAGDAMRNGYAPQVGSTYAGEKAGDVANEYASRGIQSNALGLAESAANGNQPSAAQYTMNQGLNTAMANQQAIAGGARGAGGLALAGGNMAGNQAAMQSQAYNQGGQLRAQEMAQARDLYGNLAGQQRGQDLSRIATGNQNTQFNSGQSLTADMANKTNDINYRLGSGNTAVGAYNASTGAVNAGNSALSGATHGYDSTLDSKTKMQGLRGTSYDSAQQTRAGITGQNADRSAAQGNKVIDFLGNVVQSGLKSGGK